MTLFYSGSIDSCCSEDFHRLCDGKSHLVTLYQIDDGDCVGDFTNASWSSPTATEGEFKSNPGTVLFNLNNKLSFPCRSNAKAIQ